MVEKGFCLEDVSVESPEKVLGCKKERWKAAYRKWMEYLRSVMSSVASFQCSLESESSDGCFGGSKKRPPIKRRSESRRDCHG